MTHNIKDTIMIDTWDSCYKLSWKGIITAESFSHPAKFSHALIRRIYQHIIAEGWVKQDDVILDPFGGVGLGGLYAAQNGLQWVGCELEQKFVDLGQQNIALWESKFAPGFPRWVTPVLLQGDSRKLASVIESVGCVVSSPPYANGEKGHPSLGSVNKDDWGNEGTNIAGRRRLDGKYGESSGQLGTMAEGDITAIISSPPFAGNSGGRGDASRNGIDAALFDRHSGGMKKGTGESKGNLDHLSMGSIGAVISSPPYAGSLKPETEGQTRRKQERIAKSKSLYDGRKLEIPSAGKAALGGGYGSSDGQLGSMPSGNIRSIISSPPFADSVGSDDPDKRGGLYRDPKRRNDTNLSGTYGDTEGQLGAMRDIRAVISSPPYEATHIAEMPSGHIGDKSKPSPWKQLGQDQYSDSQNNAGNITGETFWQAAAQIVQQCAIVLPSGAHCVWVVKDYVKKGKIVPFSKQWAQLCEACGFELVHIHRAWLVKNRGVKQVTMEGEDVSKETARKSFFRLLAERNGSPKIDWETVLCLQRK